MTDPKNALSMGETAVVYPAMIMRACALIHEHQTFRSMPGEFGAILDRLIKLVDCNDIRKGIFARRETLAKMAGRSMNQVKRALAWLEANGVITRNKRAHAGNRGSTSDIYFTPRVLDMLQLSVPTPSELKPGVVKPVIKREVLETGEVKYSRAPWVKVGKVRLPADLTGLVTHGGITGPGVLRLMALARKFGKSLSDVLAACQKRFKEIEMAGRSLAGRSLFVYLKKAATGERRSEADIAKDLAAQAEAERVHQAKLAQEHKRRKAEAEADKLVGQANLSKGALIKSLSRARLEQLLADWVSKSPGRAGTNTENKLFLGSLRGMSEAELVGRAT